MSDRLEFRGIDQVAAANVPAAADDAAAADASAAVVFAGSRFSFERRSSYCAETAWVWRRARFLCEKPQ